MTTIIKGIAASSGIAIAKAFKMETANFVIERKVIESPEKEMDRLEKAIEKASGEIEGIKALTEKQMGKEKAEIFAAHLLVLADPELRNSVKDLIVSEKVNAEKAMEQVSDMYISMFENMDNEYMRERAADIRDVSRRVLGHLLGIQTVSLASIQEEVIIIAEDLTPSDTAQLNRQYVKGFATNIGGRTSHSAIMSRSLELPAVVGTKTALEKVESGATVIVDGFEGIVIANPTDVQLADYTTKKQAFEQQKKEWAKLVHEKTVSIDGFAVELAANIGSPADLDGVINNGAEAVGLFRTEFLYMDKDRLPTEEEQFIAYKTVLEKMAGKPVVIRTLDIGGDKELPYLTLPKEMNPFLGYRAIRLCLDEQAIFRTQLRALLRASAFGNLKVMFPMIATIEEYRKAKEIFLEEKARLVNEGVHVSEVIEVGIMVEIPSTAINADIFAKEVDFFSIGTNDLIQYTMAADRMNEQVSYLYQPYNPAILRLIRMVINAAHQEGKWAGMCGEMAGDELAIPILLGLGLDEFSMSASSILPSRSLIAKLSKEDMAKLASEALSASSSDDVVNLVKNAVLRK